MNQEATLDHQPLLGKKEARISRTRQRYFHREKYPHREGHRGRHRDFTALGLLGWSRPDSGRVRDGDGDLILGSDSSLHNSVEDVEEDPIDRGLDEGVVVETGTTGIEDDVSLDRKEMFSDKMLKVLEMSFKAN